ncbi:hypothetical protein JTB14_000724 [Gonioctena quinquepunctata]|nr:hypothetical protein JTB14_000724 [Gonioctena quinquepunctata]
MEELATKNQHPNTTIIREILERGSPDGISTKPTGPNFKKSLTAPFLDPPNTSKLWAFLQRYNLLCKKSKPRGYRKDYIPGSSEVWINSSHPIEKLPSPKIKGTVQRNRQNPKKLATQNSRRHLGHRLRSKKPLIQTAETLNANNLNGNKNGILASLPTSITPSRSIEHLLVSPYPAKYGAACRPDSHKLWRNKVDLEHLQRNPNAIFDLLDEIGSEFEIEGEEDNDETYVPAELEPQNENSDVFINNRIRG